MINLNKMNFCFSKKENISKISFSDYNKNKQNRKQNIYIYPKNFYQITLLIRAKLLCVQYFISIFLFSFIFIYINKS